MKKLKRFVLNDARMLSRDELASIEGGLTINALDHCTEHTHGEACVYSTSYDEAGHSVLVLGTCLVEYKQNGSDINTIVSCV